MFEFIYQGQTYLLNTKRGEITNQELFKHPDHYDWAPTPEQAVERYLKTKSFVPGKR